MIQQRPHTCTNPDCGAMTDRDHVRPSPVERQRQWIREHGGTLAGYIERYGTAAQPKQGDGGPAIFRADMEYLAQLEEREALDIAPVGTIRGDRFIPGDRLRNGAIVLDIRNRFGRAVVLAVARESVQPFVTWGLDPGNGHVFSGHYFGTLREALEDFEQRPS